VGAYNTYGPLVSHEESAADIARMMRGGQALISEIAVWLGIILVGDTGFDQ
jgi:hypothetical protein